MELINKTDKMFTSIESELFREYRFPGGETVRINQPQFLSVSKSGGHRILDANGVCHYIPSGWIHLHWEPKAGQPHFVE